MTEAPPPHRPPLGIQLAVYGSGLFSNSLSNMMNIVVPLWVIALDPRPITIGLVLGARSFLPLLLSIHGGAMMDRLGTRRVMLFFATIAIVTTPLYPALPWMPALILLQMFNGLAASMGWIGAQTLVGQVMGGSTRQAGRLGFFSRVGSIGGPPAIGAVWDLFGPWPTFALLTLPGFAMWLTARALPGESPERSAIRPPATRIRIGDLLPRPGDYMGAFRLLAAPVIAFVVMIAVIRISGQGIKSSFYVVYLEQIGLTGTLIGILSSANSLTGGLGSLWARAATRVMRAPLLLFLSVALSVVAMAVTPILGTFMLLLVVASIRGVAMGMSQPLMISILAKSSAVDIQGRAVGLRTTMNRLATVVVPVGMGALMEVVGIEMSFYITGALLLLLLAAPLAAMRRARRHLAA
jgi:MFS family permease